MKLNAVIVLGAIIVGSSTVATLADQKVRQQGAQSSIDAGILVAQFDRCLQARDPERFANEVSASFRETTLMRWVREGTPETRRAAVYALGAVGSFKANAAVAQGLRDPDAVVRAMADRALRAIWFRADSLENNERLRIIGTAIELGQVDDAIRKAGELITLAPDFAEAYNQRAIGYFMSGRMVESAADCRRTIERNPYHLGALSGLGQCLLRLNRKDEAIQVFRRAAAIDPYNETLKATLLELDAAR